MSMGMGEEAENEMRNCTGKRSHFVLVHGATVGGWNWYKLTALLVQAGHTVSAPDMAACGINTKCADEIKTWEDYSEPLFKLLTSLPEHEKVILVGHSMGGFCISLAMEKFPHKISTAVFVNAAMPFNGSDMLLFMQRVGDCLNGDWGDSVFEFEDQNEEQEQSFYHRIKTFRFGKSVVLNHAAYKCPFEELVLAGALHRKCPIIKGKVTLTEDNYGSVKRVYVTGKADKLVNADIQMKMIHENPPNQVYNIEEADHVPQASCPDKLASILEEISSATA